MKTIVSPKYFVNDCNISNVQVKKPSISIENLGFRSKNPLFQITNLETLGFCTFNLKY